MSILFVPAVFIILITGIAVFTLSKKRTAVKLAIVAAVSLPVTFFLYWLLINFVGRLGGC
jgi:hypothetical protein